MRIQEAAEIILKEIGDWTSPHEVARIALERGMVTSWAKDPIFSHATTLLKHIRYDGIYNNPKLCAMGSPKLIGLPSWLNRTKENSQTYLAMEQHERSTSRLNVQIPAKMMLQIEMALNAGIGKNLDAVVACLLKKGLQAEASQIRNVFMKELDALDD